MSGIARDSAAAATAQAAGFTTELPYPELAEQLRAHVRAQLRQPR